MGAMEESSRRVQRISTYSGGSIIIYVAVGHSDISTSNVETSSLYKYEYGKCLGSLLHSGKVKIASTYRVSSILVYLAIGHSDISTFNAETSSL